MLRKIQRETITTQAACPSGHASALTFSSHSLYILKLWRSPLSYDYAEQDRQDKNILAACTIRIFILIINTMNVKILSHIPP